MPLSFTCAMAFIADRDARIDSPISDCGYGWRGIRPHPRFRLSFAWATGEVFIEKIGSGGGPENSPLITFEIESAAWPIGSIQVIGSGVEDPGDNAERRERIQTIIGDWTEWEDASGGLSHLAACMDRHGLTPVLG